VTLATKGDWGAALEAICEAIRLDPELPLAHANLALCLKNVDRLDEALAAFRKAVRLDGGDNSPSLAGICTNLGAALSAKGRRREAIAAFREAIRLDANYVRGHFNLGVGLQKSGRLDEAIVAYREAVRVDASFAPAHHELGGALLAKGAADEAIGVMRAAIRLKPDWADAYDRLVHALMMTGQWPEAIATGRKVVQLGGPANSLAWILATCPDLGLRDTGEAVKYAQLAVRQTPSVSYNTLGVAQYRAGDFKAAAAALEQSMQLRAGGDAYDWFFLSMAYWKLDRKEEARARLRAAIDWTEKHQPDNEELRRFRKEAAELVKN